MIDDMALLKQAMEQMDAEDPTAAQAAKDRAAQILSDAKLSFSKMAELIEQRQLLLRPRIVAGIKRTDQPGMLGDAAFRDTGSALRREGQSFRQIAEAIELAARPSLRYEDLAQKSEPLYEMASEPGPPAWLRALGFVASFVFFPLLHPIRFLAIALLAMLLFYGLRGCVPSGQQALGYFDGVAAVRDSVDKAMSSVSSFVNEYILRQSKEATAPKPPAPIPSPPAAAPPPSPAPLAAPATVPAPPATAPAPSANAPAAPAPPSAAPAPPSAAPAGPPVSTPRRDARGNPLQSRQRTVARRERIAIPGLVAAHPSKTIARASKTIARALSRTLYQKGSAAIPAWRGRVSVASAVAPGAVVNTDQMRVSLMSMPASWRPAAMAGRL
ncbi:MAG TPA: hypothetical protein VK678_22935, partial [Bradyrhizobium sp.]|nr:hypothetical protein [Bradyrhizobium sp.]